MIAGRPRGAQDLSRLVRAALAEDVGPGDVTTAATVTGARPGRARILARSAGVVAGLAAAAEVYRQVDGEVSFSSGLIDGSPVEEGTILATVEGPFAALLVAERTALNFLQRLSGIASFTALFVEAVRGTRARVVDTRKTTPGWRALEKSAVCAGGGTNHRMGLYDAYLVKENHIAAAGGITAALAAVAAHNVRGRKVETEVRSLAGLAEALAAKPPPDRILCDNFSLPDLSHAVARVRERSETILVEASGNITLATVRAVAESGVGWISVGALTHSAPVLDLSCLIDPV